MMKNYDKNNWLWLGLIAIGFLIGIAPLVAIAYLINAVWLEHKDAKQAPNGDSVTYHPDGSYTVYNMESTKSAPSPAKLAFRIVGGLIIGCVVAYGLFIVGIVVLFILTAPAFNSGSSSGSKAM